MKLVGVFVSDKSINLILFLRCVCPHLSPCCPCSVLALVSGCLCARYLFCMPRKSESSSMATPVPSRTKPTDDVFLTWPSTIWELFTSTPAGTTLHRIITMPSTRSPTPSAAVAYWDAELELLLLLLESGGVWLLYDMSADELSRAPSDAPSSKLFTRVQTLAPEVVSYGLLKKHTVLCTVRLLSAQYD